MRAFRLPYPKVSCSTREKSSLTKTQAAPDAPREAPIPVVLLESSHLSAPGTLDLSGYRYELSAQGYECITVKVDPDDLEVKDSQGLLEALENELSSLLRSSSAFPPILIASGLSTLLAEQYVSSHPVSALLLVDPPLSNKAAHFKHPDLLPTEWNEYDFEASFPVNVAWLRIPDGPRSGMPSSKKQIHRIEELLKEVAEEEGYEPERMILSEKPAKAVRAIVKWIEEDAGIVPSESDEQARSDALFEEHDDLESLVDSPVLAGQDLIEKSKSLNSRGPGFLLNEDGSHPPWLILKQSGMYRIEPSRRKEPITIPECDLRETFNRGGGTGGQAINKNMSRCDLLHIPTGCIIRCQETRSLTNNRKIARRRLSRLLDWGIRGDESVVGKAIAEERKRKARAEKAAALKAKRKEEEKKMMEEQGIKGPTAKAKSMARAEKQRQKKEGKEKKKQQQAQRWSS
ncbi:unnamed protein product [Sympodiomycopsis kandeliae]